MSIIYCKDDEVTTVEECAGVEVVQLLEALGYEILWSQINL